MGIEFRWDYTFQDLSPLFRTTPLAHYFANLFAERNGTCDVDTIIRQFYALKQPHPEGYYDIKAPMIILTGSEDGSHPSSYALQARVPNCELKVLPGAGHACMLEQPWLFDKFMLDFLDRHGVLPATVKPLAALTV